MNANGNGNIVERIRKLLRLARDKGASEGEAANAMAIAQKLMLEHDIKDVEEQREVHAVRGDFMGVDRGDKWEMFTASAVAKLFNCRSVMRGKDHSFVGKPENIEACQMTFIWVCEQIEELYKQGLKTFRTRMGSLSKRERANFRASFKEACATRVYHRAAEIVAAARNTIPDHMSLVVIDQSLAAADELIKNLKVGRALTQKIGFGTGAGRAAGDQVKLQGELKSSHLRLTKR